MAPAPPGNESPDWFIPPRCVTSPPRASPLPGAPAHSAAGGRKARSHCCGEGERLVKAVRKPAKCSPVGEGGGRGGELNSTEGARGSAPHQGPALLHANTRAPRAVPPSLQPRLSEGLLCSLLPLCVPGHFTFPSPAAPDLGSLGWATLVSLLGAFPLPEGRCGVNLRTVKGFDWRRRGGCPGPLLASEQAEPKCPRNLKSFSTSLF